MEADSSRGVTPEEEQDPAPATERNEHQTRERVLGSEGGIRQILDQIEVIASPVLQFTHKWREIHEEYDTWQSLLKRRALELDLKERSLRERVVELEKRLKDVEEREREIDVVEKSMALSLEEKDKESGVKGYLVSSLLMRMDCEAANVLQEKPREFEKSVNEFEPKQKDSVEQLGDREKDLTLPDDDAIKEKVTVLEKKQESFDAEQIVKAEEMELKRKEFFEVELKAKTEEMKVKEKQIEEREKELESKQRELEQVMDELEERGREVERISKCNDDELRAFDLKQKESLKQLEVREKKLSLLDEVIKEKVNGLEKKEEIFEAEQKAKAEEAELKCREKLAEVEKKEMIFEVEQKSKAEEMELKCKEKLAALEKKEMMFEVKLKAKAEEMVCKEKKLEEREKELDLKQRELQERACKRSSEARSLIRPAKRHKTHIHHEDTDKETTPACVVSASPQQRDKACEEETEEEPEIPDSEFHDFKKTMSSFLVDKIWALYDPRDDMPRLYAKIKRITKYKSSLDVTWLDHKDEESVPVACGRFTYGRAETVSHLTFSHEVKPVIHGRNICVNPKEGETWAVFRDWSQSWENNPAQHKTPYKYDLVEVVEVYEGHRGVGVTYLGKVEGFVSVFKHAVQHGVIKRVIAPKEMQRFSHRVPSVRLNGEEREGVPGGSFELDPAAVPRYILLGEKEPDVVQVGSAENVPLIILD